MATKDALWMNAKYSGRCVECRADIEPGDRIVFDPEERKVWCGECGEEIAGPDA